MKNNCLIEGRLDKVEGNMSLYVTRATQTNADGSTVELKLAFIPGRMVRYIHIHDSINIEGNMRKHVSSRTVTYLSVCLCVSVYCV